MPYRIKGTLKLPATSQPAAGVDIEFISRRNYSPLLTDLSSIIKTSPTGAYDVTLEYGEYAVVLYWGCNQPSHIGKLFVFADTATGLDLQTLLQQADWQPVTPEYIQQIQDWLNQASDYAATSTVQAEAAKTQADRAKSEADRASEISGLETVTDAIGLAAVPFPDVWIPFNDSLRMIAGFGRDVKVGADVVAMYANYERATTATYIDKSGVLRTAAINEPRFEKQGLLIEGQSTNLFLNSEIGVSQSISTQADKYTISFFGSGSISISGSVTGSIAGSSVDARVSKTFDCSTGSAAITVTGQVTKVQFEQLPFASSYIPTTTAAVTRAADKCWIQVSGNAPLSELSVAAEINIPSAYKFFRPIISLRNQAGLTGNIDVTCPSNITGIRASGTDGVTTTSTPNSAANPRSFSAVFGRSKLTIFAVNSLLSVPITNPIFSFGDVIGIGKNSEAAARGGLFGHIRNLRIWHSALSDAQIKGIK